MGQDRLGPRSGHFSDAMTMSMRRLWTTALLSGVWIGAESAATDAPSWAAAYIQPGLEKPVITLFPIAAAKLRVPLPEGMRNLGFCTFGLDGKTIYVQNHPAEAIIKLEFHPLREAVIPGTSGFASIWSLAIVERSGHIVISGIAAGQCGTFEIDPKAGTRRALLAGAYPLCGGGGGEVSPDGQRAVRHVMGNLRLTDLGTGTSRVVKGFGSSTTTDDVTWLHSMAWSPDGRWISVVDQDRRIFLIDSDDIERRRHLASSSGGVSVTWSPDSRYLLVPKSGFRCALYLYFVSLDAVDVQTGRRTKIRSSRCEVSSGWVGWIDPSIAQ